MWGDTYTYDIGPYSVIVVRSGEDTIEAFLNSCTHRGTRLLAGEGTLLQSRLYLPFPRMVLGAGWFNPQYTRPLGLPPCLQ